MVTYRRGGISEVGAVVVSSNEVIDPTPGMCMPLSCIPTGQTVHNIEFEPGKGGKLCRSAGLLRASSAGARSAEGEEPRWGPRRPRPRRLHRPAADNAPSCAPGSQPSSP